MTTQQRGEDLVPLFRSRNPEDALIGSPGSEPRANDAQLRTHKLTQELLDWVIAALSAALQTPEVQQAGQRRPRTALADALKLADHLYPLTLEAPHAVEEGLKPQDHLGEHPQGDARG